MVPVIELKQLTKRQQKAYRLADNKLANHADWDESLLKLELQALKAADFDLSLIGFTAKELSALLTKLQQDVELAEVSTLSEPAVAPVTQVGDLWLLGEHRLLCGDATDSAVLARLMDGEQASMAPL